MIENYLKIHLIMQESIQTYRELIKNNRKLLDFNREPIQIYPEFIKIIENESKNGL